MSAGRRVPEAAPLVGLVLSLSFVVYAGLFTDAALPAALVSAAVLSAFTAYGVFHSDDPAGVLRPDAVLAGAVFAAALAVGYAVVAGRSVLFGLFVGLAVAVPAALYHARYGDPVNPLDPLATLALAGGGAAVVLVAGALAGEPLVAAANAVLLVVAAGDYRNQRGGPLSPAVERAAVGTALGGALLALAYFVLVAGAPTTALFVAGALVVAGGYFALGDARGRTVR